MTPKRAIVLGSAFAGLLAVVTPLHATDLVSSVGSPELLGATAGGPSDDLTRAALSGDGRYVAFASAAANLAPGDDNGAYDVYVRDLHSGTTQRASTGIDGGDSDGGSFQPALSGDGRYVVFASSATNLVAGDTNARTDIFRRDLLGGTVVRVSTSGSGAPATRDSAEPVTSADGRYVAFTSAATDLVGGEPDGFFDVFVKDVQTGQILCASAPAAGGHGGYGSRAPSISADGRFVAFESSAGNLIPGFTPTVWPLVYVKDLLTGTVTAASTGSTGVAGNGVAEAPAISADGRFVAFESYATNLAPGCVGEQKKIYVKDLSTGAVRCASVDAAGVEGNSGSYRSSTPDGRHVVFESRATNLMSGYAYARSHIYVKDLLTGAVARASSDSGGSQALDDSTQAASSADAQIVAFVSVDRDLVAADRNGVADVFVKDPGTGALSLASPRDPAVTVTPAGNGASSSSKFSVSRDGNFVIFWSRAANIVADDTNGVADVFVRDRAAGTTVRANTAADGSQADAMAGEFAISADGRYAAFASFATNLVGGDANATQDVFVKDLLTGAVALASTSEAGVQGNGMSGTPSLSADGRYVAFTSQANNLVGGDTNGVGDIFVKDLQSGAIVRASTGSGGDQAANFSTAAAISADGRYVVFESGSLNLAAGTVYTLGNIFLKDLQTQEIVRMSVGRGAEEPARSSLAAISGDGRHVVFTSAAENLVSADGNLLDDVFHVARQADLRIGASGTALVTAGKTASFWISLRNEGPCIPEAAVVSAEVPEGTTFVDAWADRPGWNVSAPPAGGRGTVRFTRASVPLGNTHKLTILVSVDPDAPEGSPVTCTAHAESATEDPSPENLASWTSTVKTAADLDVLLGAPATVVAGSEFALQVTFTNRGPNAARDVLITTTFPDGVSAGTPTQATGPAFSLSTSGREVAAAIPVLQAGAAATFVFGGSVAPNQPEGALLRSAVVAVSETPGPVAGAGNRTASAETRVETRSDLSVTLAASGTFTGCRGLAYLVTVDNRGPSDARQVALTHELPAGFAIAFFAQTSGTPFTLAGGGGTLTAGAAVLPAGAAVSFSVGTDRIRTLADGLELTSTAALSTETAEVPSGTNRHLATATTVVGFVNEPPLAAAGGPYRLLVGDDLVLDGSGSTEPDAGCGDAIVSWEWDLDGDGDFHDALGANVSLSSAQVQALICGGSCESGHAYSLGLRVTDDRGARDVAGAQLQVVLPVFFDDFLDAGPTGDPEWDVASGRWFGTAGQLTAFEGTVDRALVRLPENIGAGVLETSVLLSSSRSRKRPNGGVIFAWRGRTRYRYARLTTKGVSIVQVGTVGGQAAGTRTSVRAFATDEWHALRVEIAPDGLVSVFVDGEATPAVSRRFRRTPLGRIGLWANRARSSFAPFTIWPPAALPWPGR